MKMRATKWIPIIEAMPPINQIILLEFGGNEYLGSPHHTVVLPAYLTYNPILDQYVWIIFSSDAFLFGSPSPFKPQEFESIHIIGLSSTHIWTELPSCSCEMVY
jgi:hypothetical protein